MTHERWRKSTYSGYQTDCVEIAIDSRTCVRDTKDRDGGTLEVPFTAWQAFTAQLRAQ